MSDLREGVVLTGRVENATLFGAFVDIGVGRNGLIHKKYITPDKLPADQRRRSLALAPGRRWRSGCSTWTLSGAALDWTSYGSSDRPVCTGPWLCWVMFSRAKML